MDVLFSADFEEEITDGSLDDWYRWSFALKNAKFFDSEENAIAQCLKLEDGSTVEKIDVGPGQ